MGKCEEFFMKNNYNNSAQVILDYVLRLRLFE